MIFYKTYKEMKANKKPGEKHLLFPGMGYIIIDPSKLDRSKMVRV